MKTVLQIVRTLKSKKKKPPKQYNVMKTTAQHGKTGNKWLLIHYGAGSQPQKVLSNPFSKWKSKIQSKNCAWTEFILWIFGQKSKSNCMFHESL